jgi:hypothetical protein
MKHSSINLLSLFVLLLLASCSTESKEVKDVPTKTTLSVTGRWVLIKSEDSDSRKTDHQHQPSDVILDFKKNGFFIIYDTLVDPKWRKKGLPLIEKRTSGQWKLEDSLLTMIHDDDKDSAFSEEFKIVRCDGKELITERSNKKTTVYRTYGKR